MNAAGYDFATFGNHEFTSPLAQVRKLLRLAKYPVLLANAVDRGTKAPLGEPWRVERVGAVRGALRAGCARDRELPRRPGGCRHLDEIATASASSTPSASRPTSSSSCPTPGMGPT